VCKAISYHWLSEKFSNYALVALMFLIDYLEKDDKPLNDTYHLFQKISI